MCRPQHNLQMRTMRVRCPSPQRRADPKARKAEDFEILAFDPQFGHQEEGCLPENFQGQMPSKILAFCSPLRKLCAQRRDWNKPDQCTCSRVKNKNATNLLMFCHCCRSSHLLFCVMLFIVFVVAADIVLLLPCLILLPDNMIEILVHTFDHVVSIWGCSCGCYCYDCCCSCLVVVLEVVFSSFQSGCML